MERRRTESIQSRDYDVLEDKDIDFDRIITEGIRHELQIQQYNSNWNKAELAPYSKALENMHSPSPNNARETHPK